MISRIPDYAMNRRSLADLAGIKEQMDRSRAQLSSGKRILRPSDDPEGAARALQFQAQLDRSTSYVSNAQSALDEMNVTDGLLQNTSSSLRAARDLVIQHGNGALDSTGRKAIADQMRGLRDELVGIANSQYRGIQVFSGTASPGASFDGTYTYQGNAGVRERSIGEGVHLTVNVAGDAVFGNGGSSMFADLDAIIARIESGDTSNIAADLVTLDTHLEHTLSAAVTIGARTSQATSAVDRLSAAKIDIARALSDTVDTDIATATTDLQLQQVAYQVTLQTLANLIKPSLLDFLR